MKPQLQSTAFAGMSSRLFWLAGILLGGVFIFALLYVSHPAPARRPASAQPAKPARKTIRIVSQLVAPPKTDIANQGRTAKPEPKAPQRQSHTPRQEKATAHPKATPAKNFNSAIVAMEGLGDFGTIALPELPDGDSTDALTSDGFPDDALPQPDTQPLPKGRIEPRYPRRARMDGVTGQVLLEFTVGADGKAMDIKVLQAIPEGVFDTSAAEAVRGASFIPATKDGKNVPCRIRLPIKYELD